MRQEVGSERRRRGATRPDAPAPAPPAQLPPGVGNHALSRWVLARSFESATAELGAIDIGVLDGTTPITRAEHAAAERERRGDVHEELLEGSPLDDPVGAIAALEGKRAKVEARHRESAQQEGHAERRAGDAAKREELEARQVTAGAALTSAQTAAATVVADCLSLQKTHGANPLWTEYEAGARKVLDDAKAEADTHAAALASVKADVKAARDAMNAALGLGPKEAAVKQAEQAAKDIAAKASDAADKLRPHKTAVDTHVGAAGIRATQPEREALREAAQTLGLPEAMASKVLRENVQASKGEIQHRLKTTREAYQSVPGPTLVTRVLGLGITHSGANTCGIDRVGEVAGKRVHLTLYWDQVPQAEDGPISLNQSDDAILDKVLGTGAMTCMHVTAEVYGAFSANNPSYYWKGATRNLPGAANTLGITAPELKTQLEALCNGKITDFKGSLAAKRTELGARAP